MENKIYDSPKGEAKKPFDFRDFIASALGVIVAVATAWMTIDWSNFTWTRNNIMMLGLSGVIAIGGAVSKIKK